MCLDSATFNVQSAYTWILMFSKVGERASMNEIQIQDWLTSSRSEFPYIEAHIIDLYIKKTISIEKCKVQIQ